ncbi:sulfurtransferase [Xanthobacter autotrophicus]|uniref:sulfurtransferase n=1 Tax=Xanthobacter autotrophicus TaxID=280 RepID=UPI0037281071
MFKMLSGVLALGLLAVLLATPVAAIDLPGPLVSSEWLAAHQDEVLVLDVRNDDTSYKEGGHLIGAVPLDFRKARGTTTERGEEIPDMNLPPEAFSALMRSAGMSDDTAVVLTHRGRGPDDAGYAAYVYWQLKYYGHDKVAILDGGTTKWVAENREVWGEDEAAQTGNFNAGPARREFLADTAQMEALQTRKDAGILDARFFSFYVGLEKRPNIAKAGHIPGATLFPFDANFAANGTYRPKEELARAYAAVGLGPQQAVAAYCNTAHVSAISWFVMHELLGYRDVMLYDGSMLAWSRHGLPVETQLR